MYLKSYEKFLKDSFQLEIKEKKNDFVKEGNLIKKERKIRINCFIPRFCNESYCENFSLQWEKFKELQLDSRNKKDLSKKRILENTGWNLEALRGKNLLECGCGPGRFTEIFVKAGANVVAIDMSRAVESNLKNIGLKKNLLLLQGDINKIKFLNNKFDYVFCYGVLQHTPSPEKTLNSLVDFLKEEGCISIDSYRRLFIPLGWSTPKYLWRPLTKRMNKEKLLKLIEWYIPRYIDFDTFIRKIPGIGIILTGLIPIPCWNYLDRGYTREERIKHAIMDTFDALSPAYDSPLTIGEVRRLLKKNKKLADIRVFGGSNGVVGNARKIKCVE
jgi:SAM-dependent methyltransferase